MAFQKSPTEGNVPTHTANTEEVNNYESQYMLFHYFAFFEVSLSESSTCLLWNTPVNVIDTFSQTFATKY